MQSQTNLLYLHQSIQEKLDNFYIHRRIPNLLFHGNSGSGKRTLVNNYIFRIYGGDKEKLKNNVMIVNCAHGKGIKFIRDELKLFAKSNLKGTQGISFKTIVLFNADNLTMDAQSALRRCIELFSHNTRFFIVVENKERLLNPILSRFCEIYVPDFVDEEGKVKNLHKLHLEKIYGEPVSFFSWFEERIHLEKPNKEWVQLSEQCHEEAISTLDFLHWVKHTSCLEDLEKDELILYFYKHKSEFRCEKLFLFLLFMSLPIRFHN